MKIGTMLFKTIAILTLRFLKEVYAVKCTEPGLTMCDCIENSIACWNQNLTQIPSNIPTNTTVLILAGNTIDSIGDKLLGLTLLYHLDIRLTELSSIEDNAFSGLQSLFSLFLSSNKISSIEDGAFSDLQYLRQLDISRNEISSIEDDAFSGLQSLVTLSLSSNKISSIEDGAFSDLQYLRLIALDNNNLTTVSAKIFDKETDLHALFLRGNPLICCTMVDFFEWRSNQNNITESDGTCTDFNSTTDIDSFNVSKCPIDGGWSSWVNSTCSVTCGNGIQSRSRTCDSPIPSGGGKYCEGSNEETLECSLIDCPESCKGSGKKPESKRMKARKWKRYQYRQLRRTDTHNK